MFHLSNADVHIPVEMLYRQSGHEILVSPLLEGRVAANLKRLLAVGDGTWSANG